MGLEEEHGYDKRRDTYSEIIKFFVDNLSDDPVHSASYVKELSKIRKSPVEMAIKVGIAFGETFAKNQTARGEIKTLLNLVADKDTEKIVHFCETYPRKWIERSGEYFILGKSLRDVCKVPDDYKTLDERAHEIIARKTVVSKDECADIIKQMEEIEKNGEKPEKKSKIKEFFHYFYEPVNIPVNLSIKPYYRLCSKKVKSLAGIILETGAESFKYAKRGLTRVAKPVSDFANKKPTWLRMYHLVFVLPAMLIGMYWLGSKDAVKKSTTNVWNWSANGISYLSQTAFNAPGDIQSYVKREIEKIKDYGALEKRIERKSIKEKKEIKIKENIINKKMELKKAAEKGRKSIERSGKIKNIKNYIIYQATTAYNWCDKERKNFDFNKTMKKLGKSLENTAEEGKSLVNGYIDERASDQLKEMERKDKKK